MAKQINSRKDRKRKRRMKRRNRIIIPIIIAILLVGGYGLSLVFKANSSLQKSHEALDRERSGLREFDVRPGTDNVSVLLMGIDSSDKRGSDEIARTDALIVATFNVKEKNVKMLTIPRDSYVYIPALDKYDKINHAHALAPKNPAGIKQGPTTTVETVENLLQIPIDYYVRLNFEAFIDVVEALDGIDVDVPYELNEQNSGDKAGAIHLLPGMQRLNGEEALALARTRKKDTDVMRGLRQQEIIKAIAKRALNVGSVLKYSDVIEAIGDNMKTNMTPEEVSGFWSYLINSNGLEIDSVPIEGADYKPGGVFYWKIDDESLTEASNTLQRHLGIPVTSFTEQSEQ